MILHIQGDIVLCKGRELVVTDVSPFEGDSSRDRLVLRAKDDTNAPFQYEHPSICQIIGHLKPGEAPGWRELGPNNWVKEGVDEPDHQSTEGS